MRKQTASAPPSLGSAQNEQLKRLTEDVARLDARISQLKANIASGNADGYVLRDGGQETLTRIYTRREVLRNKLEEVRRRAEGAHGLAAARQLLAREGETAGDEDSPRPLSPDLQRALGQAVKLRPDAPRTTRLEDADWLKKRGETD